MSMPQRRRTEDRDQRSEGVLGRRRPGRIFVPEGRYDNSPMFQHWVSRLVLPKSRRDGCSKHWGFGFLNRYMYRHTKFTSRRAEDGSQRTEDRGQKSEDRQRKRLRLAPTARLHNLGKRPSVAPGIESKKKARAESPGHNP